MFKAWALPLFLEFTANWHKDRFSTLVCDVDGTAAVNWALVVTARIFAGASLASTIIRPEKTVWATQGVTVADIFIAVSTIFFSWPMWLFWFTTWWD